MNTNVLDVWNGEAYKEIRRRIASFQILPQCRGCGLAGGIKPEYRSNLTDHIDPEQEKRYINVTTSQLQTEEMFTISITTYENPDWLKTLFSSLARTLSNRDIPIVITDSSSTIVHKQIKKIANFSGLNVELTQFAGSMIEAVLDAAKRVRSKYMCLCDADLCFLKPGWDELLLNYLQSGYDLVGSSIRYKTIAEPNFMLCPTNVIIESRLATSESGEHGRITDLIRDQKKKAVLFQKRVDFSGSRWGSIILDNTGHELVYHNYYSARVKKPNDIPEIEFRLHKKHIKSIDQNAHDIQYYMDNHWPDNLESYLRSTLD